nr:hypothetical protein [Tanacetum cinerariifolium]
MEDSQAWRTVDEEFPKIAEDSRNLWLGISADGVDVNTGNRHYSVWPILTVIYNLPLWLCMKRKFIMLSVLILGYPGNDIDEYELDSDDEDVFEATVQQQKHSCSFINTVKHVKTPRQTVKDQDTCSQNPKVPKRDGTNLMTKRPGLGYGYTRKSCFVCGSFSHLIRDCDFHEKRRSKQVELNKSKNNVTCQRNDRLMWNNVQRLNYQNKFVPIAILTKTGRFPVNAARLIFSSQAASTSTVRKVNTARPIDNPHQTLKEKGIVDSGCSRHVTENKANLVEYQDFHGCPVAFGGSKG